MTDTHCHLNDDKFSMDVEEVIKRAIDGGVKRMVVVGYDKISSEKALELSSKYDEIYASVGLHPYEAETYRSEDLKHIESLCLENKVVAIGEIGLDYYRGPENRDKQKALFIDQIEIAKMMRKPVILHVRDAFKDTFDIVKNYDLKFVFHSFSFGPKEMKYILTYENLFVSFSGMITFLKYVRDAAKISPINRTLVETDSPYLTPHPLRGRRNEPSFVKYILKTLSEVWGLDFESCERITDENASRFMDFD